ncbi:helix-turn-helix transcriptional regulator [Streptomyces sp. SL13]|uniref:Helix-turn-helix transcriptional regulator n=1 Tax=Streptantibioticus silvisoli TaxID=2705255 RepID=A0AA90JZ95_9ACTN|nr:helix-turn-helix transcriptional regulator [Streptantibioticus silvisoli]MDI5971876.1 helix-turn-helix transcriptional regulator [Streptantibioticus silvisoli]
MFWVSPHRLTVGGAMKTKLQAARADRGWTQAQLIAALQGAAGRLGIMLPSASSLKTQISMFENGRRSPGADYQTLFCEVYQVSRTDLGLALESAPSQLDTLPTLPVPRVPSPKASPEVLDYLKSVFVQHARAEPLVGPRFLVPAIQSQLPLIEELCKEASGPLREEVVRVGSRYSEFLGWLHQDSGDSRSAMLWTNRALDYAAELNDPALSAYVLQRRSNIAAEAGQAGYAVGLANGALREATKLPEQIRAVALRASANAHALLGHADESARALDEARRLADTADVDDSGLASYCSVSYIDMEAANCALALGRPADAVKALETSLTRWPTEQQRDRGLCLARLATTYAQLGDVEAAYNAASEAAAIAQATGSARILAELGRLQRYLTPWNKLVEIAELNRLLGSMNGS